MTDQPKDEPQTSEQLKVEASDLDDAVKGDQRIKRCPQCGGVMFPCRLNIHYELRVEPADKGLFDTRSSGVRGMGCGVCGFLEIYARFPAALRPKGSR